MGSWAAIRARWRRARRGVAAVEIAIVLPVMVIILTSLSDMTGAVTTWWQVTQAADAIGRIATSFAVTTSNANVLTQTQTQIASTAAFPLLPALRATTSARAGVVVSSVVFAPTVAGCTQNCSYVANVAWSATLQGGLPARPCGTLAVAADTAQPSPTTLPASAFSAESVLVVDVAAEIAPLVTSLFGPLLRLRASSLLSARSGGPGDWIRITGPTAALLQCPGYIG